MDSFVGETGLDEFQLSIWVFLPFMILLGWICGLIAISTEKDKQQTIFLCLIIPTVSIYLFSVLFIYFGQNRLDFLKRIAHKVAKFEKDIRLVCVMLFYNGFQTDQSIKEKPVQFLFTDYSRLSSVGGETSLAEMVGALTKTAERNFGILPTRIYRAVKPRSENDSSKKFCCIPLWILLVIFTASLIGFSFMVALHDQAQIGFNATIENPIEQTYVPGKIQKNIYS